MKVVLLKDIKNIGKCNEIKEVNEGYARNFLLPQGLVELASEKAVARVLAYENTIRLSKEMRKEFLDKNLNKLRAQKIEFLLPASDTGHLFSSIHTKDIADMAHKTFGAEISIDMVHLDMPIKSVGEYTVSVGTKESLVPLIVIVKSTKK